MGKIIVQLLSLVILLGSTFTFANESTEYFSAYYYGKTQQYYQQDGEKRQDVSGSAWNGEQILLAYDGGNNSIDVGVRLFSASEEQADIANSFKNGKLLTRSVMQRDIEGATYLNGSYFTTSSMSLVDEESPGYRLLVEFTLDEENNKIIWERSVDFRSKLLSALKTTCYNKGWVSRVLNVFGKRGGLNVEALSFDPNNDEGLVLGLRSPLCSVQFGLPAFGDGLSLRNGKAMMVKVNMPFSAKPSFEFIKLDLHGHGIRGMEYIQALKGYVIIGGPVEKADDYSLWFYGDDKRLQPLKVKGFEHLCRPETVTETKINGVNAIQIFSEEAGEACKDSEYTYIAATFKTER